MGELIDRDLEHLRLLKLGYYVTAGVTGFASLFAAVPIGMGAMLSSGALPVREGSSDDPQVAGLVLLGVGVALLVFGLVATLLIYFTGRSLVQRRRWMLCMVVAALQCLSIPWGTVLGVCTIIVLDRDSVRALFGRPRPAPGGAA